MNWDSSQEGFMILDLWNCSWQVAFQSEETRWEALSHDQVIVLLDSCGIFEGSIINSKSKLSLILKTRDILEHLNHLCYSCESTSSHTTNMRSEFSGVLLPNDLRHIVHEHHTALFIFATGWFNFLLPGSWLIIVKSLKHGHRLNLFHWFKENSDLYRRSLTGNKPFEGSLAFHICLSKSILKIG